MLLCSLFILNGFSSIVITPPYRHSRLSHVINACEYSASSSAFLDCSCAICSIVFWENPSPSKDSFSYILPSGPTLISRLLESILPHPHSPSRTGRHICRSCPSLLRVFLPGGGASLLYTGSNLPLPHAPKS